jgi:hypothetical protein
MSRFLNWVPRFLAAACNKQRGEVNRTSPARRAGHRVTRPKLEPLEDRDTPTVLFQPHFASEALDPTSQNHALESPHIELIYWGSYWASPAGRADVNTLTSDIKTMLADNFVLSLVQYGGDGQALLDNGNAPFVDPTTPFPTTPEGSPPAPVSAFTTEQLNNYILSVQGPLGISKGAIPVATDFSQAPTIRSNDTLYAVITGPGVQQVVENNGVPVLNPDGTVELAGVGRSGNQLGSALGLPYHFLFVTTGSTPSGAANTVGAALTFSHELAEGMSYDDTGAGIAVDSAPGDPTNIANGHQVEQIADMEPEAYSYRLGGPNGPLVAPIFSNADGGDFLVSDGNAQHVILTPSDWSVTTNPDGTTSGSFGGHYGLTINGDQLFPGANDELTIASVNNNLQVTLNGETFNFDPNTISTININLGSGNDRVAIDRLEGQTVNINLGSGTDTVDIGDQVADLAQVQGRISVIGGTGSDTLIVTDKNSLSAQQWRVSGSSVSLAGTAISYTGVANLVLDGGANNDTFILSPTAFNLDELPGTRASLFPFQTSLMIDGGAGLNSLVLNDQNNPHGSIWDVEGNTITRRYNKVSAHFVESVTFSMNYSNIANLTIHAGSGGNTFDLASGDLGALPGTNPLPIVGTPDSSLGIDGGTGNNTLVLNDQNDAHNANWSVTGSALTRSFQAPIGPLTTGQSFTVGYSNMASVVINAGNGNDTFALSPTAQDLDELPGTSVSPVFPPTPPTNSLTVNGGTGANTLILDDQNDPESSNWSVTGNTVMRSHIKTVGLLIEEVTFALNYNHIADLEVHAGKGDDTVTLSPTARDLDELPGTNFEPHPLTTPVSTLSVDGGAGNNSLILDDQKNTSSSAWTVTDASVSRSHKPGSIFSPTEVFGVSYRNVANVTLNSGSGNNSFLISSTPATGHVTVNGGTGANGLTTNNGNHIFTISGRDSGTYANVSFNRVSSLTGGTGLDIFKFTPTGSLDGSINGGGAPAGEGDWLDYSACGAAVTVDLTTDLATAVAGGISNIQNVIGSSGTDTLFGNARGNILIGGAATNSITGGSGRSFLIGGTGTSTITGGSGDDILLAGTTTFDGNESALMAVLREWQRTDKTSAQRIADLRSGGGFNGPTKLILGTTVLADDTAATLSGAAGVNWYFGGVSGKTPKDVITDPSTSDVVN